MGVDAAMMFVATMAVMPVYIYMSTQFRGLTDWFIQITEKQKINQLHVDIRGLRFNSTVFFNALMQ